ncbi:hypothetical protein ATI02_3690 [Pseudomonas baetica]|uniref:Uncharacterized protein n=1 Tax=Pseudomonas baetica TaxID=674054 RepID=A0ABX4Q1W5_9PSED|nr:hypothetical protein ATI02_3690 [Pseudomonas baetica]
MSNSEENSDSPKPNLKENNPIVAKVRAPKPQSSPPPKKEK